MTDRYTHLRLSAPDPIADLQARMAEAGVRGAVVVETWDGENRRLLPAGSVFCYREGVRPPVDAGGLRIRTAHFDDAAAWVELVRGGTLYVHAEAGIGALARRILEFAAREPDVPVFVPHMGWPRRDDPDWAPAIRDLAGAAQVSIGLSAMAHFSAEQFPHRDTEPFAGAILEAFGAGRVAIGSDYPLSCGEDYARYIGLARAWRNSKCRIP